MQMTAKYNVEASMIAVDVRKTKFALLDINEQKNCINYLTKVCRINSLIFPINLSKLCVISIV